MKLEKITKKIFNIKYPTQKELSSAFLRFQGHYESPKFRGKFFTLYEFKKWYICNSIGGEKTGKFTYYQDWGGFNIPSHILSPFYSGKFDPLSKKEKRILDLFESKKNENFYIIGTFQQFFNICRKDYFFNLQHEIAHGLFYTNSDYKKEILNILDKINPEIKQELKNNLKKIGYHSDVLIDEMQAYLMNEPESFDDIIQNDIQKRTKKYKKLNEIFDKYFKLEKLIN